MTLLKHVTVVTHHRVEDVIRIHGGSGSYFRGLCEPKWCITTESRLVDAPKGELMVNCEECTALYPLWVLENLDL